jgi:hypothetical protein
MDPLTVIYLILAIIVGFIFYILSRYEDKQIISRNIHYHAFFDKSNKKLIYHKNKPFYQKLNLDEFRVLTINFDKNYKNGSLKFILSGNDTKTKYEIIEGIASEFDYGIIHFPINNYSELSIKLFFNKINQNFTPRNIIVFEEINFNSLYEYNKEIYDLLLHLVIENYKNNIFIFNFLDSKIPRSFLTNFLINNHYNINKQIIY